MFNSHALEYLVRCKKRLEKVPQDVLRKRWAGKGAESWFETVKNSEVWRKRINNSSDLDWNIGGLSASPLDRFELQKKISELTSCEPIFLNTIKTGVIEIFAWGGMRIDHARKALPCIENYQEICQGLLSGQLTSVEAYKEFFVADHSKELEGMGPAYYTKLIYFLGDQTGLILDQWTGRSINTLCEDPVVNLDNISGRKIVSKSNGPKHYAKYLEVVERLRIELNLQTLPETEELIFSCSDQKGENRLGEYHPVCSAWRKYVRTGEQVLTNQ